MFEDDFIYSYSRKDAIEDGDLVDVTSVAHEAGFRFPVAITRAVHEDIKNIPDSQSHQDYDGRLWDVLYMLMHNIKSSKEKVSTLHYELIMHTPGQEMYKLKSVCGPGDDREPVITIMLPWES